MRVSFGFVEYNDENNFVQNISSCRIGRITLRRGRNPTNRRCATTNRTIYYCFSVHAEDEKTFAVVSNCKNRLPSRPNEQRRRLKNHTSFQTISCIIRVKHNVYTGQLFFTRNITFLEKCKTFLFEIHTILYDMNNIYTILQVFIILKVFFKIIVIIMLNRSQVSIFSTATPLCTNL